MRKGLQQNALEYHQRPTPGKIAIAPTKPLATQQDLALAYSPGVAAPCEEIAQDPTAVAKYTARANLVAVITNGTAVLGLGNIGPLAAKPVMEGKAVLFKKFAGIDVFDIEIKEEDPDKLVDIIASLEPTFGGINLEDIKAPQCFEVERKLHKRMNIPVFHDDQHGTAIIVAAAILNGLKLTNKKISDVHLVTSGGGAAAIACLDLLVALGMRHENIIVTDLSGVVYEGRPELTDPDKLRHACKTKHRTLEDALEGADIFLGLSVGGVLKSEMIKNMAAKPLILALANPTPEINPTLARQTRADAIIATGRSDYPNQVNNVLCFPFIFRGALDVGATIINQEMKLACVHALAELTHAEPSDIVATAYTDANLTFGPDYIIPKPFDPRLILKLAPAVAKAAMETGVATNPIKDFGAYEQKLKEFVFRSGLLMKPIFHRAQANPKRVVFAEGEDERVLRAAQIIFDEKLAHPVLIGRPDVISHRLKKFGLRLETGRHFTLVDPQDDPRYRDYYQCYHSLMERRGVTPDYAKLIVRTNTSVIGALMVYRKEADALLCGPVGRFESHLQHILPILGPRTDEPMAAALTALVSAQGSFFFCDPYVNVDPTAEDIATMTMLAADKIRNFGLEPRAALISHSNFGSLLTSSAQKMQKALDLLMQRAPDLAVDGEMHADSALCPDIRQRLFPNARLQGQANLLVMPNLDAANIAFNMVKAIANAQTVGPLLLGMDQSAHILTPSVTVRGIVNMAAIAAVDAQNRS